MTMLCRLRIEVIICSVALVFIGSEIILCGAMVWTLQRYLLTLLSLIGLLS